MPTVYLNGAYLPADTASVSVNDRGFFFGDGVYEVWRLVDGQPFEFTRHHERLARGLHELRIAPPAEVEADALRALVDRLVDENGLGSGEGTLYLQVTRGVAPRTHQFPPAGTPATVYAYARPLQVVESHRTDGVAAIVVPDVRWLRCDIKTIQLLPNILANQKAKDAGAFEAIFVRNGTVTEATHSNVFAVLDGTLCTHPSNCLILNGVTREVVLELARELGIDVAERPVAERDLPRVTELFVTGTTTDVTPIVRLDDAPIGDGRRGPVAARLYEALQERLGELRTGATLPPPA